MLKTRNLLHCCTRSLQMKLKLLYKSTLRYFVIKLISVLDVIDFKKVSNV
jgi:hypothetical protein